MGLMKQAHLPLHFKGFLVGSSFLMAGCQAMSMQDIQTRIDQFDTSITSTTYIARAGETLETIAFRYDTDVATLQRLNPDALSGVRPGMPIFLDRSRPEVPAVAQATTAENTDVPIKEDSVVQLTPAILPNAEPLAYNPRSDEALLNGYPIEEVIEDDNFLLPSAFTENELPVQSFSDDWQWPLNGQLARDYDPQRPNGRGIEIVGLPGQEVYAARSGVVDWVARSPDGVGKVVIVRHEDDYLSIYSNAQDLFVAMTDTVKQGDPIASLGANANDEPLLRFEISKGGSLLNPLDYLSPR